MATGITKNITEDTTFTSKYEMTKYDDVLNIIAATVTLAKPAGDIFTNEGDDTVTITDSTITASALGLSFLLGSGNDTLNIRNSTIDAPTLAGSGDDIVVITGAKQSQVNLVKQDDEEYTLNLGANDDVLELRAILMGDGDVTFGTGNDTLRFNGGTLLTTGTLGTFSILEVMAAGGTLGRDLTLAGTNTQIKLNGALFGSAAGKLINIADSTTVLNTGDNIRTDVTLNLSGVTLTQADGGSLEFSGHTGYAITANNSTVTLHDIVTQAGNVFTGNNTIWNISDSNFANSTNGIYLTGGTVDLDNVGMSDYTNQALRLSGTKLTGAKLAFTDNCRSDYDFEYIPTEYSYRFWSYGGAIFLDNADMEINDLRMNGNQVATPASLIGSSCPVAGGAIHHASGNMMLTSAVFSGNTAAGTASSSSVEMAATAVSASADTTAVGGAIHHTSGIVTLTSADFSANIASATAQSTASGCGYTTYSGGRLPRASSLAFTTAIGGAVYHTADDMTMTSAGFAGNIAAATATASAVVQTDATAAGITATAAISASASASACGGAIYQAAGKLTLNSADFSGNIADAIADATASGRVIIYCATPGLNSAFLEASAIASAAAAGGAIHHAAGDLTITGAAFSGNIASAGARASSSAACYCVSSEYAVSCGITASASAYGGALSYSAGKLNLINAAFSGNIASASADPWYENFACAHACGGGGYIADAIANFTDTEFVGNIAAAMAEGESTQAVACGGALYLTNTTLTYTVTSGTELVNTGNQAVNGGFLYMTNNSTVNLVVEENALLTIGDDTNNDSFAGDRMNIIQKQGTGYLLINSNISAYQGLWTVYEGTLELARIARTITLDDWTIGENALVILSSQNDTINMTANKNIGTIDLGGGSDVINTNGYALSNGALRISTLKFTGGGTVSSAITTRNRNIGFDLTLDDVILNSDITGGVLADKIYITQASTLGGTINLGNGDNVIDGTADTVFKKALMLGSGSDTVTFTGITAEGAVNLGDGVNTLTASGTASFARTLTAGAEDDTLNFADATFTGGVSLGGGSDTLTATGTAKFSSTLDTGDGNDTLTFAGVTFTGGVSLGGGSDTLTATGTAKFSSTLDTGDGNDTLTFADVTFSNTLNLGDGADALTATYAIFKETAALGAGNDTLTFGKSSDNSGTVSAAKVIDLGDGDNTIIAYGTAEFAGIAGCSGDDTIDLYNTSTISGELDLGGGENVVYVEDSLTMTDGAVKMTEDGETRIIVYRGTTLTDNTLTVYADANAERETATYSWANQTDLDKVRLVVSSDHTFETFEFAVELYNKSKSFTLNLEKGYYVQFQANDEDGWKQRLVDDAIAPNQVTGVEFNGKSLTWDVTHDNLGGNGVKQYTVEMASDSSFTDVLDTRTVTDTEYTPLGLGDGTYYFRVCAEDYTQNIGEWSATASGQLDTVPPSRPSGGKSTVNGYNVTLSWNAATDTGSGVAEYEYRVATDSTYSTIVRSDTTATLSVTENGLAYGNYYWQVRAIDKAGNVGEWSMSKTAKTQDLIAPTAPGNVDYGVEESSVTVVWDASQDDALGSGLKGYEIQLSYDSSFSTIVKSVSVTETEALITNLADGDYYMRVSAVDNAGNYSTWSSTLSFTIGNPDVTPPTNPSQLTVTVDNQNAILSWTASIDTQSGVAGYTIYYSLGSEVYSVATADTSYTLTDLAAGTWSWSVFATDNAGNKSGTVIGDDFEIKEEVQYIAKSDVDGNTISDVMFQYTGGDYQIGFWMNGSSTWQGTGVAQPDTWELLGNYDMDSNGKADQVMVGNVEVSGVKGAYIGYYQDGDTTANGWQNIGYLSNSENIAWDNAVGNLTGNAGANSIVWHAAELGALGVWTDGTDNWVSLGSGFDSTWTMQGCGDFTGDGKDEILWQYDGNFYTTDIDGNFASLGGWGADWVAKAIGDFDNDGKDDIIVQNGNMVVKFKDGKAENWESVGAMDASDWFICGAGDYNGDEQDDLLVRQYSTGMLGYYESGDMSKWVEMGRGVDMNWTVIA